MPTLNWGHRPGTWGRRTFIEIANPWDAKNMIRAFLTGRK